MASSTIDVNTIKETKEFAIECAKSAKPRDIFLLNGPLGAGKSVFAREFIQYFAQDAIEVPSPTFTLVQTYDLPQASIWHFDLYRLEDPEEIYEIGWEEALEDSILLIEWPERLGSLMPKEYHEIIIQPSGPESRKITHNKITGTTS